MGVEEETSAAKRDEKEQQIYELEQKLSDADRAAGIRVIEVDGGLYYDYTTLFKSKLDEYLDLMAGAQLSDATAIRMHIPRRTANTHPSFQHERRIFGKKPQPRHMLVRSKQTAYPNLERFFHW